MTPKEAIQALSLVNDELARKGSKRNWSIEEVEANLAIVRNAEAVLKPLVDDLKNELEYILHN